MRGRAGRGRRVHEQVRSDHADPRTPRSNRSSWSSGSLRVLDRLPDALGRRRHLDVLHAQPGERVDDRVHHGAERRRRPAFRARRGRGPGSRRGIPRAAGPSTRRAGRGAAPPRRPARTPDSSYCGSRSPPRSMSILPSMAPGAPLRSGLTARSPCSRTGRAGIDSVEPGPGLLFATMGEPRSCRGPSDAGDRRRASFEAFASAVTSRGGQ